MHASYRLSLFTLSLLLAGYGIFGLVQNAANAATVQYTVSQSSDDAEEREGGGTNDGDMTIDNAALRFGSLSQDRHIGLRFTGVTIPSGAVIQYATIRFRAAESDSQSFTGTFYGEYSATPATFTTANSDISNRSRTTANVSAGSTEFGNWTSGSDYQSPDLSSIIQELVNSADYSAGRDMVVLWIYGSGSGERIADAYDGNAATAPTLTITYTFPYFQNAAKTDNDADNSVVPGETVTYTITIPNDGPANETGVTVTDEIEGKFNTPYNFSYTNCGSPTFGFSAPTATWSNVDINTGATCIITYDVDVANPFIDGNPEGATIDNMATINPDYAAGILAADSLHVDVTPDLSGSTKTDDVSNDQVAPGQTVTFALTLNNTGDGSATGVYVHDTLDSYYENLSVSGLTNCGSAYTDNSTANPPDLDITDIQVDPGTSCVIEFTADVDANANAGSTLTNTANILPANEGGNGATPNSDTLTVVIPPDLSSSTKTDNDPNNNVEPGDTVTYTISLENTGGTDACVTTTDQIHQAFGAPYNFSYANCGSPVYNFSAPTATWSNVLISTTTSCAISYDVDIQNPLTLDDPENAVIINEAVVTPAYGAGILQADALSLNVTPNLSASTKTDDDANNLVIPGQLVTYTLELINSGDGTGTGIDVSDVLDANLENLSIISVTGCGAGYTDNSVANPAEVNITGLRVNPDTSCVIVFQVSVAASAQEGTDIPNTATIRGSNETQILEDISSDTLTVSFLPDLSGAAKTENDADNWVKPGDTVTYTIAIPNTGYSTGTGIDVTDTIDPGYGAPFNFSFTGCGNSYTNNSAANIDVTDLEIAPGETCTITYDVTVDLPYSGQGVLYNSANISAPDEGGGGTDGIQADTLIVDLRPDLSTSAKVDNDVDNIVSRGQIITYTLTLINSGYMYASMVSVTDALDADLENLNVTGITNCGGDGVFNASTANPPALNLQNLSIAPGENCIITFTATVTSDAQNGATIPNTAVISAPYEGGPGGSPVSDTLTIYVPTQSSGGSSSGGPGRSAGILEPYPFPGTGSQSPPQPEPQVLGDEDVVLPAQCVLTEIEALYITPDLQKLLNHLNLGRNSAMEMHFNDVLVPRVVPADIAPERLQSLQNFVNYGTASNVRLGQGERAGVVDSYRAVYGDVPANACEWQNAVKIADTKLPYNLNTDRETQVIATFKKIYGRDPNQNDQKDNIALKIMAYGIRPQIRDTEAEYDAIQVFKAIFGHLPGNATEWDAMRAVAYSGIPHRLLQRDLTNAYSRITGIRINNTPIVF